MADTTKKAAALAVALDVRKFEIELYWKRATYFWVFTGAALAAHIAAMTSDAPYPVRSHALLLTSCIGLVFSLAWYLVNRASKYWQANWESHVDMLENDIQGPLYKTALNDGYKWWVITDAYPLSVSRINQFLSFFVFVLFAALALWTSMSLFAFSCKPTFLPTTMLVITPTALLFLALGTNSKPKDRTISGTLRETKIQ